MKWKQVYSNEVMRVRVDTTSFKAAIEHLILKEAGVSCDVLDKIMIEFKEDCLEKIPKCPVRSYDLYNSHFLTPSIRIKNRTIGTLRVEQPYAASIHEGISRWGTPYEYYTPDTGSHWILSKMLVFGDKYLKMIAKEIVK